MAEYKDDPELTPAEKEVAISYSREDNRMSVHSEIGTVTKWLANHPEFQEKNRREKEGAVVSITGTLPVGCLNLKGNPRNSDTPGRTLGRLPE